MIPAADIRKRGFNAGIGLDHPGDLLQPAAEFAEVLGAVCGARLMESMILSASNVSLPGTINFLSVVVAYILSIRGCWQHSDSAPGIVRDYSPRQRRGFRAACAVIAGPSQS